LSSPLCLSPIRAACIARKRITRHPPPPDAYPFPIPHLSRQPRPGEVPSFASGCRSHTRRCSCRDNGGRAPPTFTKTPLGTRPGRLLKDTFRRLAAEGRFYIIFDRAWLHVDLDRLYVSFPSPRSLLQQPAGWCAKSRSHVLIACQFTTLSSAGLLTLSGDFLYPHQAPTTPAECLPAFILRSRQTREVVDTTYPSEPRSLTAALSSDSCSPAACIAECTNRGYMYAGVECEKPYRSTAISCARANSCSRLERVLLRPGPSAAFPSARLRRLTLSLAFFSSFSKSLSSALTARSGCSAACPGDSSVAPRFFDVTNC
jgi:hypothetical protein